MTDQDRPNDRRGYEWDYPRTTPASRPAPLIQPERNPARGSEYDPPHKQKAALPPPPRRFDAGGCALRAGLFALGMFVFLLCGGLLIAGGLYLNFARDLPSADQLATAQTAQSTKIYDRNGGLLYEVFDANQGRRTVVSPDKLPLVLKQATLATEDPTFYSNPGVDWYGVARAIYYLARYRQPVVGGSTITQQLVKRTFLTPEVTIERKLKEAILALEVSRRYSKDQILAFYLNSIFYGNLAYGIQAASQAYFQKDVSQLNLAEASLLAGLPQAPSLYDPCVNPDLALERQAIVLGLMVRERFITESDADAAAKEMRERLAQPSFSSNCESGLTYTAAPHFVEYVRSQLEAAYGADVVYKGGLQVYTTLDPQIQKIVEDEARKQIAALKGKDVSSAAVVAVNPQNGEIYAMLGSVDFNDKNIDGQVNVATRLRQPGSSIKPITYVAALERGWTAATPIYDLVTEFPNGAQPPYVPKNYDGKEHGLVSLRSALANSYNIPAVKTLYFVGVPEMMGMAQRFGITTFTDPSRYGLSLTLGGGEVKLVELTGAYAVFANHGRRAPLTPFRKIVDGMGRTVLDSEQNDAPQEQIVDPRHAYLITNILADNAARTPAFGANSPLKTARPAFVKTGTTNDFKDNWTLGGTPELVLGVWVGNPRNQPMKGVSGISGAAPIWHNVLERIYQEHPAFKQIPPNDFAIPSGLVRAEVCRESGLIPTPNCPADRRYSEIFVDRQAPTQFDDVWIKLRVDTTNGLLATDNCPSEIVDERLFARLKEDVVMPYAKVRAWGAAQGYPVPPEQTSPCADLPPPDPARVRITHPDNGMTVSGVVQVNGIANVPSFGYYVVEAGRAGQWVPVATSYAPAAERSLLAQFDVNPFGEGELDIRLTVFDIWGAPREDKVRVYIQYAAPPPPPPPPTTEPTRRPRRTRTPEPTLPLETPTLEPTVEPTIVIETPTPTEAPTEEPTLEPTLTPTETPAPTEEPTLLPSPDLSGITATP